MGAKTADGVGEDYSIGVRLFPKRIEDLPPPPCRPQFSSPSALTAYTQRLIDQSSHYRGMMFIDRHKAEVGLTTELVWLIPQAEQGRSAALWMALAAIYRMIAEHCRLKREREDKGEPRLAAIRCLEAAVAREPGNFEARGRLGLHLIAFPDGRDLTRGREVLEAIPLAQRTPDVKSLLASVSRHALEKGIDPAFDYAELVSMGQPGLGGEVTAARAVVRYATKVRDRQMLAAALDHLYRVGLLYEVFRLYEKRKQSREQQQCQNPRYREADVADSAAVAKLVAAIRSYSYAKMGTIVGLWGASPLTARDWELMAKSLGPAVAKLDVSTLLP